MVEEGLPENLLSEEYYFRYSLVLKSLHQCFVKGKDLGTASDIQNVIIFLDELFVSWNTRENKIKELEGKLEAINGFMGLR